MVVPRNLSLASVGRLMAGARVMARLDETQQAQALIALVTSHLGLLAAAATLLFTWGVFTPALKAVTLVALLLFGLVAPLYRWAAPLWDGARHLAHHCIPAALCVSCGFAAVYSGGILPLASIYAPAIPLLTVMICGARAAVVWSAIMAGSLALGIAIGPVGSLTTPPPWLALAGGITVLVPTLLTMLLHHRVWTRAVAGERQARERLWAQHDEQRALDKRLSEHERSESLGLMAGRIAHDLNNFLTGMAGNAALARVELEAEDTAAAQEYLSAIERAAANAGRLSGQLLDYTGKRQLTLASIELRERLRTAIVLAQASLEAGSRIEVDAPDEVWIVGDPTQFDQIVVNLIRNADQAYAPDSQPGPGVIWVCLEATRLDQETACSARGTTFRPGPYARLSIRDEGRGIEPSVRSRMFDPFVSDRDQGKGLGLASVAGIVEAHGGGIQVHTELGRGTEIEIYFPLAEAPEEAPRESRSAPVEPTTPDGHCTVLVADDQEAVRQVIGQLLQQMGHRPLFAENGQEALDRVREQAPAGVILDVAMPKLDGHSVLRQLRQEGDGLPAVLISGYAHEAAAAMGVHDPRTRFLQKPFSAQALRDALTDVGMPLGDDDADGDASSSAARSGVPVDPV